VFYGVFLWTATRQRNRQKQGKNGGNFNALVSVTPAKNRREARDLYLSMGRLIARLRRIFTSDVGLTKAKSAVYWVLLFAAVYVVYRLWRNGAF